MRWIDKINRDDIIAQLVAGGLTLAQANLRFDQMLAARAAAKAANVAAGVAQLQGVIDNLQDTFDKATEGRAWIEANAPAGSVKNRTLLVLDEALVILQRRIDTATVALNDFQGSVP